MFVYFGKIDGKIDEVSDNDFHFVISKRSQFSPLDRLQIDFVHSVGSKIIDDYIRNLFRTFWISKLICHLTLLFLDMNIFPKLFIPFSLISEQNQHSFHKDVIKIISNYANIVIRDFNWRV